MLLGCVKTKRDVRSPARDLYTSPLWNLRRQYAETSGCFWYVISAEYGLVHPNTKLDPYDVRLDDLPARERAAWGQRVVGELQQRLGPLDGMTFEVHAGRAYAAPLKEPLAGASARLQLPVSKLALGMQPQWYAKTAQRLVATGAGQTDLSRVRPAATTAEVRRVLRVLNSDTNAIPASDWNPSRDIRRAAGMYSWWVDSSGARDLTGGLGTKVRPGLIYAGQTGATFWPSGKRSRATLGGRIGGNHLNGGIAGSTFRLTLAGVLRKTLEFRPVGPKRLDQDSESILSSWMAEHLSVVACPFSRGDMLADLEDRVLRRLNPPLNIEGMKSDAQRRRLHLLRTSLGAAG